MLNKKIIVVDDNPMNLNICKQSLKNIYDVYLVRSAENMFDVLKTINPDLILLDVEMPGIHGYEAIKMLKSNDSYKEIPVIFLSAMDDAQSEMEGLDLGAVDYIHKPFVNSLLVKRIDTHIKLIEGQKKTYEILFGMGNNLRAPLEIINEMVDASINSNDINEIKNYLEKVRAESRLIAQIISSAVDTRAEGEV